MTAASGKRLRYVEIADAIRQRVRNGEVDEEGRVGTFGSLQEDYGAAKGTVDKALGLLREEGVVVTIAGKGIFAAGTGIASTPAGDRVAALEAEVAMLREQVGAITDLRRRVEDQDELLAEFIRELKEQGRLLARIRQRLDSAGINLSDPKQQDGQAM